MFKKRIDIKLFIQLYDLTKLKNLFSLGNDGKLIFNIFNDVVNFHQMSFQFCFRCHADAANLTDFSTQRIILMMTSNVQRSSVSLSKSFSWAKWTFEDFLAGMNSMVTETGQNEFNRHLML